MPHHPTTSAYFANLRDRVAYLERAVDALRDQSQVDLQWARAVREKLQNDAALLCQRVGRLELLADAYPPAAISALATAFDQLRRDLKVR